MKAARLRSSKRARARERVLNLEEWVSSQFKCLIPISQRAAKAVRAKTLRVLVVFCGAAPPVWVVQKEQPKKA
jgi:hypothetical protein